MSPLLIVFNIVTGFICFQVRTAVTTFTEVIIM